VFVVINCHVQTRHTGRDGTYLKTLTDHPIFATSPLNVSSSEVRVSDERVFESVVVQRWRRRCASHGDHRTCKAQIVELFLVRRWAIGDAVNQRTEHWTATGFIYTEYVWSRCCRSRRVIGVRGAERSSLVDDGRDVAWLRRAITRGFAEG
jgi:hypothetical protein